MPSFSIVVETENLANGDSSDLLACLDSIAAQRPEHLRPNEIILVESGQVAEAVLDEICRRYPLARVHVSHRPLHYYDAKLEGARFSITGVIVFADADLRYDAGWLAALLAPVDDPATSWVTGETRVAIDGPYTFSVATTWLFPLRYDAGPAPSLIANNCAVRRQTLLECPFPTHLPLYRAQIVVHGRQLRETGHTIQRVRACGRHAPPSGVREWALRYLVAGADAVMASTWDVVDGSGRLAAHDNVLRRIRAFAQAVLRKVGSSAIRTAQAIAERPLRMVYAPLALPISVAGLLLFACGAAGAVCGSRMAYRWMQAFEAEAGGVRTFDVP